ncbi:MAG: chromosome partitioning protein [Rectinemataceae bacterium]
MDESDFSGFDFAAARKYIAAYSVDIKRYDKAIAAAASESELWSSRAKLAEGKGLGDLAAAAQAKADDAAARLAALQGEREELKLKVARLRQQLPSIRARERSIDPDRLLAELQIMTGELIGDSTDRGSEAQGAEREIARLAAEAAADAALAALKKKMDPRDRGSESDPSRRK